MPICFSLHLFFFNDTATTEIYTLSLHDALPISPNTLAVDLRSVARLRFTTFLSTLSCWTTSMVKSDRKSTRLNSSHQIISYAVFCLKKKKISNLKRLTVHASYVLHSDIARAEYD